MDHVYGTFPGAVAPVPARRLASLLAATAAAALLAGGCASTDTTAGAASGDASQPPSSAALASPAPGADAQRGRDAAAAAGAARSRGTPAEGSVFFAYDSTAIEPRYQPLLEAHAGYAREAATKKIVIQGNTDERGSREYNLALGQRRAEEVAKRLALQGVAGDRIEAISYGKEKPAAECHEERCWAKNRRADIVYPVK